MNITKADALPALTIRRTFKAPRDRVFHAFTDAALMQRWMGPPGTNVTNVAFDAREGGTYSITFATEQGEMTVKGVVTALRPPEHLAYTWRWEEDDAAAERDTFVRIDFIAHGDETETVLTHEGFADETSRANHDMGWNGALGKIDALL